MASSSNDPFSRTLDQELDEFIEQEFENLLNDYDDLEEETEPKKKRVYINRDHAEGHMLLWYDYFCDQPLYPPNLFRRRFRMNKHLFMQIVDRLSNEFSYFPQKRDATGKPGLSPLQKCTTAIRILAYGAAADQVDEYVKIGASTALKCLTKFVERIIYLFGDEYLRRPTPEDLHRLLYVRQKRGFPGMIGSIDCMHWEWKNCPTAWKGQYSRASGKPTIVLEAVASYDLWIWHAFFGSPGTLNDINILHRSPVFDDIIQGKAPKVSFSVNENDYHLAYYLTDGIYPKWATFIQSIPLPQGPKPSLFAERQESVRKDVERAFGVLQSRFAIAKNPALYWDKSKIGNIMKACIILHNMIVEDERAAYTQYDVSDERAPYTRYNVSEFVQGEGSSHVDFTFSTNMPTNFPEMMAVRNRLRDRKKHEELKNDLVNHIWQQFGPRQH